MSQLYPVGKTKFVRAGADEERMGFQKAASAWDNVLTGKALARFHERFVPKGLREQLARLKPTRSRRGASDTGVRKERQ